jgi:hypothetical protein
MSRGKSIQQVIQEMNYKNHQREIMNRNDEKNIQHERRLRQQKYLEDIRLYEKNSPINISPSDSPQGGGDGGSEQYISQIDTIWLYPQSDINSFLAELELTNDSYTVPGSSPSVVFTKNDNVYSFTDLNGLVYFWEQVYQKTALSQPTGNAGYSLGVGTRTIARTRDRLVLKLNSGIKVSEWALMRQITNQSDLPVGGNSPNGTIGWGSIYCDWNLDGSQDQTNIGASFSIYVDGIVFKKI